MTNQTDPIEIFQAALDTFEEGIVVLDVDSRVLFWSNAATAISGHQRADTLSRLCPPNLYEVQSRDLQSANSELPCGRPESPLNVQLRHRQGHTLSALLRRTPLRNTLGHRFGTLLRFHPIEEIEMLPHSPSTENASLAHSRSNLEEHLNTRWHEMHSSGVAFGILWLAADQASALRQTHGHDATETMMSVLQRTLTHGLSPKQILGRWDENEFLIIWPDISPEALSEQAQHLLTLTPGADFRWWGDRVELSLSVGAAHSAASESLACLLHDAQDAMQSSIRAGGNRVISSRSKACSQS